MGCNDAKLIACLLTRTKAQLQRTKKRYREKYDKELRSEVEDETSGSCRKLMHFQHFLRRRRLLWPLSSRATRTPKS